MESESVPNPAKLFPAAWLCLAVLIVCLPLIKGGNTEWMRGLSIVISLSAFMTVVLFSTPDSITRGWIWWVGVWGAVTLLILFQFLPLDLGVSGWVKGQIPELADEGVGSAMTVDPLQTLSYWSTFSAYWAVAWMTSLCSRKQLLALLQILLIMVVFQSVYGLVSFAIDQQVILGLWQKVHYLNDITGTFVNRNHFAGFFVIGVPVCLAFLSLSPREGGLNLPGVVRILMGLLLLGLVMMSVIGSHSRMGTASLVMAIFVLIALRQFGGELELAIRKRGAIISILIFVCAAFFALWFGVDVILDRYARVSDNLRQVVWASLIHEIPLSVWLTGIGAGTFEQVFKIVSPVEVTSASWHQAHSDWIEFVLDFGILGSGLILLTMILWFVKLKPHHFSILQVGALSGIIGIAMHSAVDFPLQKPGVAIVFWFCVGMLMNRHLVTRGRR